MNLHQLRIFCAVVNEGSFRQAAEKLFLSQPSVSQQVAALEKDHNLLLFERRGRSISITPEGRALYVLASDLIRQADEIPSRFRDMRSLRSGELKIGASTFAGCHILPGPVREFHGLFPAVSLTLSSGGSGAILADLRKGGAELAVLGRNFPFSKAPDLTYRVLGEDPLVMAVSPGHPWAGREGIPFSEAADHTLLQFTGECPLGNYVDEFLLRSRINFGRRVSTDDMEGAKYLAAQGVGAVITSRLSVKKELASGELAPASMAGLDGLSWEIQCVHSSSRGLSYAGWEMMKLLEEHCRVLLG
jgi:DNA-binding transcriptional LysR family regulator